MSEKSPWLAIVASIAAAVFIPIIAVTPRFPFAGAAILVLLGLWLFLFVVGLARFGKRALWMLAGAPFILIYLYVLLGTMIEYHS
jgi:hypothetical protein